MLALASADALCALEFGSTGRMARLDGRLARWFPAHQVSDASSGVIDAVRQWLGQYFAGDRADGGTLPLDLRGAPFERRVWAALRDLRPGETTTYGAIARKVGSPSAARAVGMANGANPIAIIVPCHRVIGADGRLTGYGGGLDRKTWLINHERRWRNALPL
ncbi:MAG: methylated-DNA--[protein]-cysteine S-methyltransferase [Luteitalea sp.]|nr:methylated-DNA--[protein]-cysteine S-methyltransferase [Luteitalea sp.]